MTNSSGTSVYLDNAATSFPKPEPVYEAVDRAMRTVGASPGRGGYIKSLSASRILMETRELLAALFNLPDSSRMIFTNNTTMSLNMALMGTLKPGDHLITSSMEHNSLLRPIFMMQKQGVEVSIVKASREGIINPDDLRAQIMPNTRMIAVAQVSNVTGGIQPVERISEIAREAGALMLLDAAQSAGTLPIDMQVLGVDILAAPGHKGLLGPQGTGILAVMPDVEMRPVIAGGTGVSSDMDEQPESYPEGFEAGTHNLPGIAGLGAAVSFITQTGVANIAAKGKKDCEYLRHRLEEIIGCKIHGPSDPDLCHGVVPITLEAFEPSEAAFILDSEFDIAVRAGLHCAPHAHRTIGTYPAGTIRISPGWFNTTNDLDKLLEALKIIARKGDA